MDSSTIEWPSPPNGMGKAERFDDKELNLLINALHEDSTDWFSKITPPNEPPQLEGLPEFIQQDIIEKHQENLEATPEEPTESYRQKALDYHTSVRDARNRVRPDSLTKLPNLPIGITRNTQKDWVFYGVTDEIEPREDDVPRSLAEETEGGKYLFFTPEETGVLETIIFEQFKKRPFESAKVPTTVNQRDEIVLCLYYGDDRYKSDLRESYQNEDDSWGVASPYNPDEPVIKPRGYKIGR